jgi:hypothetical protein
MLCVFTGDLDYPGTLVGKSIKIVFGKKTDFALDSGEAVVNYIN